MYCTHGRPLSSGCRLCQLEDEGADFLNQLDMGYIGLSPAKTKRIIDKGQTLWVRDGDFSGYRYIPENELKDWRWVPDYGEDKHWDYVALGMEDKWLAAGR